MPVKASNLVQTTNTIKSKTKVPGKGIESCYKTPEAPLRYVAGSKNDHEQGKVSSFRQCLLQVLADTKSIGKGSRDQSNEQEYAI
jgi:hypothetical protein